MRASIERDKKREAGKGRTGNHAERTPRGTSDDEANITNSIRTKKKWINTVWYQFVYLERHEQRQLLHP